MTTVGHLVEPSDGDLGLSHIGPVDPVLQDGEADRLAEHVFLRGESPHLGPLQAAGRERLEPDINPVESELYAVNRDRCWQYNVVLDYHSPTISREVRPLDARLGQVRPEYDSSGRMDGHRLGTLGPTRDEVHHTTHTV